MEYLVEGYDTLIQAWLGGEKIRAIKALRQMYPGTCRWVRFSEDGALYSSPTLGLKACKDAFEYAATQSADKWTDHRLYLLAFNLTSKADGTMTFPQARVIFPRKD